MQANLVDLASLRRKRRYWFSMKCGIVASVLPRLAAAIPQRPHERNPKSDEPSIYGDPSTFVYSHGLVARASLSGHRGQDLPRATLRLEV
ncbi:hypothetical protein O9993_17270 [Vibrio lentus]|nr:hypothetical protein [Vibrio lentus]